MESTEDFETEYRDDAEVLHDKIRQLANMIKESKHCVFYTGN